jgi:sugar/nucleoside kinase (ribokinase family)
MVTTHNFYDIAFIGHYTKDTIVSASGTRIVDGGAFNYGANVAARMGLKVAAVTRLAKEDLRVVEKLKHLGVDVFVHISPKSTCLRLEYPTSNLDERIIYVKNSAGIFTPAEVEKIQARAIVVGASMRDEVSLEVIEELAKKKTILAADVQSFIRVNHNGKLIPHEWPEKQSILSHLDVLKTDAIESEMLTGTSNIREAARKIADLGPREVVITHRNGLLVYVDSRIYEEGFFPKKLIGRSGRGDTCIAAYMSKRLNASPQEATTWAAAITSLKMEAEGPFQRTMQEVNNLIQSRYRNSN